MDESRSGGKVRWSRRRFLGALTLAGGGALLAACGGSAPMATSLPATSVPATSVATANVPTATVGQQAASTLTTPPASPARPSAPATPPNPPATPATPAVAAGTPSGTPGGETPIRPGPPGTPGASPTPLANPTASRMLALVPQRAPLPGVDGIWFADVARQKGNYGFADITSQAAFMRLSDDRRLTFNNTIAALPLPEDAGRTYAALPAWREATGYDFWQVDRTIQAGSPPQLWTRLEGRFNRAGITGALQGAGHQSVSYQEATILMRGQDGQLVDLPLPLTHYTLARLNRVVLEEGALTATSQTALAQAGIDVRAGRVPSFAADPDYAALLAALGPVVGAMLLPPTAFYGAPNPSARPTPTPTPARTATPVADRLPPYNLVGLGLRDDGKDHAMVIALLYANQADARTGATVLLRRLASYRLTVSGQRLSERAEPGDAELVAANGRTIVVVPLQISDEPSLSLWLRMYANRDYAFLGE